MTMGTASTMGSMVERLVFLPITRPFPRSTPPLVLAHMSGRRIVEMVREDLKLSKILKKEALKMPSA